MKSTYSGRNGGNRQRVFHKNDGAKAQLRRKKAFDRLNIQLIKGTKYNNGEETPLSESDLSRIHKEISILETKLK